MSDFPFKTQNATLRELAQCKALLLEQSRQIESLRERRDELLAALDTTVKAIMIFRNEPMLERLHGLRSSAGYGVLQQAMDIGRDAIASVKGGAA